MRWQILSLSITGSFDRFQSPLGQSFSASEAIVEEDVTYEVSPGTSFIGNTTWYQANEADVDFDMTDALPPRSSSVENIHSPMCAMTNEAIAPIVQLSKALRSF